jgi:hypothetical protein
VPGNGSITDPVRLRALAHPLRWTLIDYVERVGTATVTQCAEATGASVASCWYHLSVLAKYGYMEQVSGNSGREKPWRRTDGSMSLGVAEGDHGSEHAHEAAVAVYLRHQFDKLDERLRSRDAEPRQWRRASTLEAASLTLTADEFKAAVTEITAAIRQISARYAERTANVPEGAREVGLFFAGSVAPVRHRPR